MGVLLAPGSQAQTIPDQIDVFSRVLRSAQTDVLGAYSMTTINSNAGVAFLAALQAQAITVSGSALYPGDQYHYFQGRLWFGHTGATLLSRAVG